jgi:hypothetical protein
VQVDLYALPPEEFTAARDQAAKTDPVLKKLRRPSVAAWVVNTLVRQQGQLLEDVLGLGAELAAAQSSGQGAQLRELTEQRHQLVQAVTQQAAGLVDRPLSPQVTAEVAATLEAAMADPASAEAVRSGRLVRSLSYAGFGGAVDLDGAVAVAPSTSPKPDTSKKVAKLETAALNAQGGLDDAVRHAERVARELEGASAQEAEAQRAEQAAQQALEQAQAVLTAAERDREQARSRRTKAGKEVEALRGKAERASRAVTDAQTASDAARQALDAVRRG